MYKYVHITNVRYNKHLLSLPFFPLRECLAFRGMTTACTILDSKSHV